MDGKALMLAVLAAFAGPALAINKCIGPDGRITYTDGPCSAGAKAQRIEAPPPVDPVEQAAALARGQQEVEEARRRDARIDAAAAERQRRYDAERRADEEARRRQEQQDVADHLSTYYPAPVIPRYRHPAQPVVPVLPKPKPVEPERPAPVRNFPFR